MKKSQIVLLLFIVGTALASYAADVPTFEFRHPLAPEDPALLFAGLGGVGVAVAYLRAKLKK